jgi:hypothetical protein
MRSVRKSARCAMAGAARLPAASAPAVAFRNSRRSMMFSLALHFAAE